MAPEPQGTGLGRKLVAATEKLERGVCELFLLTETAAGWFPRLGYAATIRTAIPAALMASPEIAVACPETAAVLRKRLYSGRQFVESA